MPAPTAAEIYQQVRRERPRGWRWFSMDTARRVERSLANNPHRQAVSARADLTDNPGELYTAEIRTLAENVRTNNGAVGFGAGAILTWLAWKLVEACVWWAIQWAWRQEWSEG